MNAACLLCQTLEVEPDRRFSHAHHDVAPHGHYAMYLHSWALASAPGFCFATRVLAGGVVHPCPLWRGPEPERRGEGASPEQLLAASVYVALAEIVEHDTLGGDSTPGGRGTKK